MKKIGRLLTTSVAFAALATTCSSPPPDESGYITHLLNNRAEIDRAFREGPDSPVPLDRRVWMLPLHYYEPDLSYRVPAKLKVSEDQPIFEIPTSTGEMRTVQRVGRLEFMLNSEPHTLSALVELPAETVGRLFVPFRDETNRIETYPAGRYLDLDRTPTNIYDLDFNRAYNPYCYYDEQYECPFPPPENRLAIAIRAGEKLPPKKERRLALPSTESSTVSDQVLIQSN